MDVTMPDGTLIQNVPDGTSRADLLARLKAAGHDTSAWESAPRMVPQVGTRSPLPVGGTGGGLSREAVGSVPQPRTFSVDPTDGMSQMDLLRAGAGKAISNAGTGLAGLLPGADNSDVPAMRQRDAPLMNTTAGQAGNIAGQVGIALAPGGVIRGAGVAADALGASRAGGVLDAIGREMVVPSSTPAGVLAGTGTGAAVGAAQPAATTGERTLNILEGAGAGGALPAVGYAVKAGKSLVEPFYEGGRQNIVGRVINKAAGNDAPNALQRITDANMPTATGTAGELVPGSYPTTSQVAGNPGISALEQATMGVNPNAKTAITDALTAQNAARVNALTGIAGDDVARTAADSARSTAAQAGYGKAFSTPLDPQAVASVQPTFDALSKNPYIVDAVPTAQRLAAGDNVSLNTGSVQGMHYLKLALDDAITKASNPQTALGNNTLRQLRDAQSQLVGAMDQVSPEYAAARKTYADMSAPINQMDVGQTLLDRSIDPLTGKLRPGNYARALNDTTAAKATGLKSATLDSTMTPEQNNTLKAILDDLSRASTTTSAGRGIGSNTLQNLAYANMIGQTGVPTWLGKVPLLGPVADIAGNLAARAGKVAYGDANNQLAQLLAEAMTDPTVAQTVMSRAPYAGNSLAALIARGAKPLALAAPGVVNAR